MVKGTPCLSLLQYSNTPTLHAFGVLRVPPGECGFESSDGNPGTNGAITKLAAERGIKAKSAILQAVNTNWSWPSLRIVHTVRA